MEAEIKNMSSLPDSIKEAFKSGSLDADGTMDVGQFAALLQRLDGNTWGEERVGRVIEAAGGVEGRIRLDRLLAWIFASPGVASPETGSAPTLVKSNSFKDPLSLSTSFRFSEVDEDEIASPKIGRKGDANKKKKAVDPWDAPPTDLDADPDAEEVQGAPGPFPSEKAIDPTSPHLTGGDTRPAREKRARAYEPLDGEELYIPESHRSGVLLLRPDATFAYIHDCEARFSEGVQGTWVQQEETSVRLEPTSFGWCYAESFDDDEIIGNGQTIVLCKGELLDGGKMMCKLPDELVRKFSWMDPTLPEE